MNVYREPDAGGVLTGVQDPMRRTGRYEQGFTCLESDLPVVHLQSRLSLKQTHPLILRLYENLGMSAGRAQNPFDGDLALLQQGLEPFLFTIEVCRFEQIESCQVS